MATIDMTDLDWLQAYSNVVFAAFESKKQGSGYVAADVIVPVTFDASEEFEDFGISFPFNMPGGFLVLLNSWTPTDALSITQMFLDSSSEPPAYQLRIWGSNTVDEEKTVTFNLSVMYSNFL